MLLADRIQARAVRRMGELLKEFDGRRNNQHLAGTRQTREAIAHEAGVSEHQRKQAIRVANVPAAQFEQAVEAQKPPTACTRSFP